MCKAGAGDPRAPAPGLFFQRCKFRSRPSGERAFGAGCPGSRLRRWAALAPFMAPDGALAAAHRGLAWISSLGNDRRRPDRARYRLRWSLPLGWDRLPGQTLECFSGHAGRWRVRTGRLAWPRDQRRCLGATNTKFRRESWPQWRRQVQWELRWAQPPMGGGRVSIAPLGLSLVHTLISLISAGPLAGFDSCGSTIGPSDRFSMIHTG